MRTTHSPHVLYTYRIPYWPCLPCLLSCACRQVGLNDSLGHCDALLEECVPGVPKALNLPLSTQGTLELVLTYTPSGMETSAAALAFAQGKSAFGRRGSAFGTRRLPAPPGAAGVAAAAFGSPPPKGRRLALTPASVSRVKCFFAASPGSKLSRLQQARSRRTSCASAATRYQESSPGAAPCAAPGAAPAAAPGAAPAAAAAAAASGKTRLSMLVSSQQREEQRHRRRRLAAMIAAAKAAVDAGQTDLSALAWGGARSRVLRLWGWGYGQLTLTLTPSSSPLPSPLSPQPSSPLTPPPMQTPTRRAPGRRPHRRHRRRRGRGRQGGRRSPSGQPDRPSPPRRRSYRRQSRGPRRGRRRRRRRGPRR